MDDGGGFIVSWEVVRVLNSLGLKPKRTIRAVVWVNEENGDAGKLSFYSFFLLLLFFFSFYSSYKSNFNKF